MPSAALKSVAKKAHKPHDVAEHDWEHAKKIVKKEYGYAESNPRFWALVMGITKKMLGIKKESVTFKTFFESAKKFKLGTKVGKNGEQEPAYGFEHEGMFIHNPYESSCGRFLAKPSDYGLTPAEAKQLVNMNNLLTVKKLIKK